MPIRWVMLRATLFGACLPACLFHATHLGAQSGPPEGDAQTASKGKSANIPVFQSTTTLVYLDVTVVDKKGNPVVTGLTRDDFIIAEDKQPQSIFSFEAPGEHSPDPAVTADENLNGKSPRVTLILDLLNSRVEDFAYIRDQARKFLEGQPEELNAPVALMVSGNQSLDMLQGYTRNRSDLLFALDHLPALVPWKNQNPDFLNDRIRLSYIALTQIAIQNRGVPGRKIVAWIGPGGPNLDMKVLSDSIGEMTRRYIHHTINMLMEDRISLYLIRPQLVTNLKALSKRERDGTKGDDQSDVFLGDAIHFTDFVDGTGGKAFNLNNIAVELGQSVQLGSGYYTLTYQPHETEQNGSFRRIQVTVRNPDLQAITKVGYFAPESKEFAQSDNSILDNLMEAAMATMPFNVLNLSVANVVRHPDARSVEVTLQVADKRLAWQTAKSGQSSTTVIVTGVSRAVSRYGGEHVLASRVAKFYLLARSQDPVRLAEVKPEVKLTLPYPKQTKNVRVVLATDDGARIGSVDLDKKTIDAAPEMPSPQPAIFKRGLAAGTLEPSDR